MHFGNSETPPKLESTTEQDEQIVTINDSDHGDLQVMAIVNLDEDDVDDVDEGNDYDCRWLWW